MGQCIRTFARPPDRKWPTLIDLSEGCRDSRLQTTTAGPVSVLLPPKRQLHRLGEKRRDVAIEPEAGEGVVGGGALV
jgi:hypothetical protein